MKDSSYIECISLCKNYRSKRQTIDALVDVNLQIGHKEFLLIKGNSGAGKSTLLHLIGGLIKPSSGKIRIGEYIINELKNKALSRLLANEIGIIFQSFNLLPTHNLYENIEVALLPVKLGPKETQKLIIPYFEQFHLTDKLYLLPSELSVGQQQKVAILRTLIKNPRIILADEPTGSVDDETATEILGYLKYLNKEKNVTIILATHGSSMDNLADRIVILDSGRIIS